VWQGAQREGRNHPHFFGSKLRLHTFENIGHKPVAERNDLLHLPVCGCLFGLELKPLFILLLLLAEMDFACPICAYLHESAFLHSVRINRGLEVVAEVLFGACFLLLPRFPRNDLDIITARNNRCLSCDAVPVRNQGEIRHLLFPLGDVRVQLAIKASGVRARIILDLGEEERVKSGALRAVGATSGAW
jgi:hypothetical protein